MTQKGSELHDDAVGGDASVATDNVASLYESETSVNPFASVEVGTADNPLSPDDEFSNDASNVSQGDAYSAEQLVRLTHNLTLSEPSAAAVSAVQDGEASVSAAIDEVGKLPIIKNESDLKILEKNKKRQENIVSKFTSFIRTVSLNNLDFVKVNFFASTHEEARI